MTEREVADPGIPVIGAEFLDPDLRQHCHSRGLRDFQNLIVIPADGLLIEAGRGNDFSLLSSLSANSSILPDNHVTFRIDRARMQAMLYGRGTGQATVHNALMEYEILYVPGLYREGQLKTIATQVTSEQLASQSFNVTFPKAGWYTIIIRNQERTREYTTFFISATSN